MGWKEINVLTKISATTWAHNQKIKHLTQKNWQKSTHYNRMKKTDPITPLNKYINLITKLPRKLASILSQLRIEHVPLAKHLHRIGQMDSPICPACKQSKETMQHFMLHYPAYHAARQSLWNSTGGRNIDVTKLFTSSKTFQIHCKNRAFSQHLQRLTRASRRWEKWEGKKIRGQHTATLPIPYS